jgi:DNA-binding NarL/FixJ family response regulator
LFIEDWMVMGSPRGRPVRLAVVSDFELVVAGVEAMLSAHRDRVVVVELAAQVSMASNVDVVLWDACARPAGGGIELRRLPGQGAALAVFGWTAEPASEGPASTLDVTCYLWKGLTGPELVEAVEAVCERQTVGSRDRGRGDLSGSGHWPGIEQGLTRREAEMLGLIARGLSNQEIADAAFLSINSVKTHIRTAYRKLGVTRRSQAVGWVIRHRLASGDMPDRHTTGAEPANGHDRAYAP